MAFHNQELYEIQYSTKSEAPWIKAASLLSCIGIQGAIRPKREAAKAMVQEAEAHGDTALPIWIEINFDQKLQRYLKV